jgi:hypothetical protein
MNGALVGHAQDVDGEARLCEHDPDTTVEPATRLGILTNAIPAHDAIPCRIWYDMPFGQIEKEADESGAV